MNGRVRQWRPGAIVEQDQISHQSPRNHSGLSWSSSRAAITGSKATPIAACLAGVAVCMLAFAAGPAKAARKKKRARRPAAKPLKVLILGSSSMNGSFGDEIAKGLRRAGYVPEKQGKSSSGFARPDYYDWQKEIAGLKIGSDTAGALIYLGTNDGQAIHLRPTERRRLRFKRNWLPWSHAAWSKVYARRVSAFARALCARGAHRVAILTPVDVVDARLSGRLRRVRQALARGAGPVPCARAFTGRGDLPRILRQARRRRLAARKTKRGAKRAKPSPYLRQPDGTHLTRHGARVVWQRVEGRIKRWFKRGPLPKRRPKRRSKTGRSRRAAKARHR